MAQAMTIEGFKPLEKSSAEWKKLLPADRYGVLFEENTERPFTSPLNDEKRSGAFVCAACFLPLFDSSRSTTAAPAGRASSTRSPGPLARKRDFKLICRVPNIIARVAAGIRVMSSMMAPRRPTCATATTVSLSCSCRRATHCRRSGR